MAKRFFLNLGLMALIMAAESVLAISCFAAEKIHAIPPFFFNNPVEKISKETISEVVLAGGCFWGMQGVFQHVKGMTSAVSGYIGGKKETAHYALVSTGTTNHAEAVKITFDPRQISYDRILQIYFSVAHDPTQLNRQGPDVGTQYRSAIFPTNPQQVQIAKAYISQLNQARVLNAAIVTKIEPERFWLFYAAEPYHQNFLIRNPTHPYIVMHDLPKIEALKHQFPDLYRAIN